MPIGGKIAVTGVILAIGFELRGLWLRHKRRWLRIEESGFEISLGDDRRWYEDRHVTALACSHHSVLINGSPTGTLRRFQVWLLEDQRPLVMENVFPLGALDPLAGFINRLLDSTIERARQTIREGGAISGAGWRLDSLEFSPRRRLPIARDEVTAVGEYDGCIAVWRHGDPKPIFKTRCDNRNAILLQMLLQAWLNERAPASVHEPAEPGSLGRLLFQRRVGYIFPSILLAIGAILGGAGLFFRDPILFAIPAGVFAGVGLFMLIGGGRTFRCHEHGVLCRGVLMKRALLFTEVEAVTYAATQHYRNGSYDATTIGLAFTPLLGTARRPVEFEIRRRGGDAELEKLRDLVSAMIARQMAHHLATQGEVPWTKGITLRSDGFEYRAALMIGKKQPVFIPYSTCQRFELAKGIFTVFAIGQERPVITETASAYNFFPGYCLLVNWLDRPQLFTQPEP